jgi:hypothetical protein
MSMTWTPPTAAHCVADEQEMAVPATAAWGDGWMDQDAPSQTSKRGAGPFDRRVVPVAWQDTVDEHETPFKMLSWSEAVLGLATMLHEMPFHCSTSVC